MDDTIQGYISDFLAATDPRLEWLKPIVREANFLPLYLGWLAVLGIRPDGSFIRWDCEERPDSVTELSTPYLQRLALCDGLKRYPALAEPLPARPPQASTCVACGGSGQTKGAPQLICECGGVGWLIEGEPRGEPTG